VIRQCQAVENWKLKISNLQFSICNFQSTQRAIAMTSVSRTAQFAKVHKVLKKHCKPATPGAGRTVIEHLLFACCLEDAHHDAAEEGFAALVHTFFDWNEVRVTSISELSEVMACLPDPRAAANRIKRVLHSVFEATFNFDLEDLRKKNLGPTIAWLEKLDGTTPFVVSYVVQAALGGHAIPIDAGTMAALCVLELVSEKDAAAGVVPGLERAVAKSKGIEFASMLHELGADYSANPYSSAIRDVLLQINPECASRLPKRRADRSQRKSREPPAPPETATKEKEKEQAASSAKLPARRKRAAADVPSNEPASEPPKKKTASPPQPPSKPASSDKTLPQAAASKKRSVSEGLAKRKPR
jgi:endonuclease III